MQNASFGHSTWFGIGAYAAGLIQLHLFPGEIWLPLLLSTIVVGIASTLIGAIILRPSRRLFLVADAGVGRADLHHGVSLE